MQRLCAVVLLAVFLVSVPSAVVSAQPADRQPEQQGEFVPMSGVPPEEQLPAAPLLVAAYAFVWVAVLFYIVSLARRLTTVQGELQRLERTVRDSRQG